MSDAGQECVPPRADLGLPPGGDLGFDATEPNRLIGKRGLGRSCGGIGLSQTGEKGIDGNHKDAVGHTENDSQHHAGDKAEHVRAQIGQTKRPNLFQFLHQFRLAESPLLFEF